MAKELEIYKQNQQFLDIMYLWYRDLFVYIKCNDEKYIIQKRPEKKKILLHNLKKQNEADIIKKNKCSLAGKTTVICQ